MFGTLLFTTALALAVAGGLVTRAAMRGATGHQVEAMGRFIGG
jgi:hypothetical protein